MDIVDPRIDPRLVPPQSRAKVIAEHQTEYQDLPSVVTPDGKVISRWHPSDDDLRRLLAGEDLYLTVLTFNQPLQPVLITVGPVDWSVKWEGQ